MANVITLSDSDSDELLSFADRVRKMITSEKEEKSNKSPKQNLSQFHAISDSDDSDSRETIPLGQDRNVSPPCSLPGSPKHNLIQINDSENLRSDTWNLNHKPSSPVFSLPDLNDDSENLRSDTWNLNHKPASPVFSLPDLNDDSESLPYSFPEPPNSYSNQNDENMSSDDDDICIASKKIRKGKRSIKDPEKEQRKKLQLEKKKEKEHLKALKASEKEILKQQKPEECLKNMKVVIDKNILSLEDGQKILDSLNSLSYSIEENNMNYSIEWYRKVVTVSTENYEIIREEREEFADTLILIIPNEDFLKMIHSYVENSKGKSCGNLSLEEFIVTVKSLYPDCGITCITIGFKEYLKNIKKEGSFDSKTIAKQIHKNAAEEAVIQLQLQMPINFKFLDNMSELGSLLCQFTKATAEAPRRREKENQKSLAFSWYADNDSQKPIKLTNDRSSFINLWRQQIQQFQNVGPDVADAIVSRYSSPRALLKAYKRCTPKDAENLLQDIVVRRDYGPLSTNKRIGPELSFKLYLFFTTMDGNKLLKR